MKYPFTKQKDLKDCGVCCLQMLVRYFGGSVSIEYLRELTCTTKDGVNAYNLIEGSKKIGFSSYGLKGNIEDLNINNTPCIAHVLIKKSYQHFIVIYKINKKNKTLLVADPNDNNIKKISYKEFKLISTNVFIIIKPDKKILYVSENKTFSNFIFNIFKTSSKLIIMLFTISLLISFIQIICSFQFKILLKTVINYKTTYNLIFISLLFLLLIIFKELLNYIRNQKVNAFNHHLDKELFLNVYNHILSLPYFYYKNRTTGEVLSRINDLSCIRNVIGKFIINTIIDLFMLVGSFICLFILSKELSIIVLTTIILLIFIIFIFSKVIEDRINKTKKYSADVNSILVESIDGIETIKNQNIVDYIKKKFLIKYSLYNDSSYNHNNIFIIFTMYKNILININNLVILCFGSYLTVIDKIDIATLITFITLNSYILSPIENLMDLLLSYTEAKVSFNRIKELYEIEEENIDNKNKLNNIKGDIKVDNLKYSYNNIDYLLKNINLDIKSNSKILLYGKSGSGKSTIAKILAGTLNTKNNIINYNNYDINKYNINALKKDICYISSNEKLFTTSVYNNIVLDKEINPDEFYSNAKLCMVDEFIDKKNLAYDTLIEENGFNFSGGEKQRIILARSLLKDSNIYILDEALNQVDIDKERNILINLFNKYPNKTFIYISHRFHNKDLFDKKYKIEDGISYEESI